MTAVVDNPQPQPQEARPPETALEPARSSAADDPRGAGAEDGVSRLALVVTSLFCVAFAVFGHAVLWWAHAHPSSADKLPWQPAVGISIVGVAILSVGGFYAATKRSRVGLGAGFLLTFLVLLTYALTIDALPGVETPGAGGELLGDFRWVVVTVAGSFFGGEAAVAATKVLAVSRSGACPARVEAADGDLHVGGAGS